MHVGVKAKTLRTWSGYSSTEASTRIPDDQVLVIDAFFDDSGKLTLDAKGVQDRVGGFVLHTIRAHVREALENVTIGQSSSEGGGWQQWLRSKAEGLVAETGPLVGLERAGGGIVPSALQNTMPWDA
jgi:hypothetical protein